MTFTIKILLAMKMTALILFIAIMQVSAGSYAQKITLSQKNAKLQHVFKEIWKQSGYDFVYDKVLLQKAKPVSFSVKDATIEEALTACFDGLPFTYSIDNKIIVVKQKEVSLIQKIMNIFSVIDVRGKVIDENGLALPGATVKVKGTGIATVTNEDGEFFLKGVPEDAIIVIAYLGYKPLESKVTGNIGAIKLELKTSELDEVTVSTGYWETSKRLSVGNISKVTAKEIGDQPVVSPLLALQGRVAGLEISMPSNAAPGAAPTIRIRGNNSLRVTGKAETGSHNDGNVPLYVIDGVPVISTPLNSMSILTGSGYDPLSTINPTNIESIEILKDADATAIYGSRGANGVILITTKQNQTGKESTNFDIIAYTGVGQISRKLELLNTEQYLSMRREALLNSGLSIGESDFDLKYWDPNRYTDWQEVLLGGAAKITDFQGNISGGNGRTSFRLAGGYHKETSIFSDSFGYSRVSGQGSINHTSNNERFRVGMNVSYGLDNNNLFVDGGGDVMRTALSLPPNAPSLYNVDGTLNWEIHTVRGLPQNTWANPISSWQNKQNTNTKSLISSANIGYELIDGLFILTNLGYTDLINNEKIIFPKSTYSPTQDIPGVATPSDINRKSWIVEPRLSYSKNIKSHSVDMVLGGSWQASTNNLVTILASQYSSDALLNSLIGAGTLKISNETYSKYKYQSFYGRLGYNWKNKYLINLTGRRDASSRFAPENRVGNFGALGLGWIFSEEPLLQKHMPFLSFGKLRGSFGINGSDAVNDYQFYNLYNVIPQSYDGIRGIVPNSLYNPDFVWEETKKLELGLELGFLNNRMGMDISWYRNRSSNQLVNYTLPYTTGFPSILSNFDAIVQNTGLEGVFRAEPVITKNWQWRVSFNLSVPRNKLLKFDGIENSPYVTLYKVGEPLSVQWLYTWAGVDQQTGLHTFLDKNNDGKISNLDRTLMNPTDVRYYGGANNTLQFKNLELSVQFQFSKRPGARVMPGLMPGYMHNQPAEVLNRWFSPGDDTDIQKFAALGFRDAFLAYLNSLESSYNTEDITFLKLKSLSLNYLVNQNFINKLKLQQVRIFVQGQNLLTFTKYRGLDPETAYGLPPLRMLTTGIQIRL